MLDADADPAIVRHFVPHAGFFRIDTRREAEVVQAQDLTLSNAWLLNHEKARAHRATVARILRSEVTRAGWGNVLVVTNRDVLRQLHHEAGTPFERDDASPRQSLHGAEPRWFPARWSSTAEPCFRIQPSMRPTKTLSQP